MAVLPCAPGGDVCWLGPLSGPVEGALSEALAELTAAARPLPLAGSGVAAGFPSPADDYVESTIDLNRALVPHPTATFLMRAEGEAMRREGIHDGDLLVVDRSVEARPGCVVVAVHAGRFVLRRVCAAQGAWRLIAADPALAPIPLHGGDPDLAIWGVVIHAVHHLLPRRRRRGVITRNPGSAATPPAAPSAGTRRP